MNNPAIGINEESTNKSKRISIINDKNLIMFENLLSNDAKVRKKSEEKLKYLKTIPIEEAFKEFKSVIEGFNANQNSKSASLLGSNFNSNSSSSSCYFRDQILSQLALITFKKTFLDDKEYMKNFTKEPLLVLVDYFQEGLTSNYKEEKYLSRVIDNIIALYIHLNLFYNQDNDYRSLIKHINVSIEKNGVILKSYAYELFCEAILNNIIPLDIIAEYINYSGVNITNGITDSNKVIVYKSFKLVVSILELSNNTNNANYIVENKNTKNIILNYVYKNINNLICATLYCLTKEENNTKDNNLINKTYIFNNNYGHLCIELLNELIQKANYMFHDYVENLLVISIEILSIDNNFEFKTKLLSLENILIISIENPSFLKSSVYFEKFFIDSLIKLSTDIDFTSNTINDQIFKSKINDVQSLEKLLDNNQNKLIKIDSKTKFSNSNELSYKKLNDITELNKNIDNSKINTNKLLKSSNYHLKTSNVNLNCKASIDNRFCDSALNINNDVNKSYKILCENNVLLYDNNSGKADNFTNSNNYDLNCSNYLNEFNSNNDKQCTLNEYNIENYKTYNSLLITSDNFADSIGSNKNFASNNTLNLNKNISNFDSHKVFSTQIIGDLLDKWTDTNEDLHSKENPNEVLHYPIKDFFEILGYNLGIYMLNLFKESYIRYKDTYDREDWKIDNSMIVIASSIIKGIGLSRYNNKNVTKYNLFNTFLQELNTDTDLLLKDFLLLFKFGYTSEIPRIRYSGFNGLKNIIKYAKFDNNINYEEIISILVNCIRNESNSKVLNIVLNCFSLLILKFTVFNDLKNIIFYSNKNVQISHLKQNMFSKNNSIYFIENMYDFVINVFNILNSKLGIFTKVQNILDVNNKKILLIDKSIINCFIYILNTYYKDSEKYYSKILSCYQNAIYEVSTIVLNNTLLHNKLCKDINYYVIYLNNLINSLHKVLIIIELKYNDNVSQLNCQYNEFTSIVISFCSINVKIFKKLKFVINKEFLNNTNYNCFMELFLRSIKFFEVMVFVLKKDFINYSNIIIDDLIDICHIYSKDLDYLLHNQCTSKDKLIYSSYHLLIKMLLYCPSIFNSFTEVFTRYTINSIKQNKSKDIRRIALTNCSILIDKMLQNKDNGVNICNNKIIEQINNILIINLDFLKHCIILNNISEISTIIINILTLYNKYKDLLNLIKVDEFKLLLLNSNVISNMKIIINDNICYIDQILIMLIDKKLNFIESLVSNNKFDIHDSDDLLNVIKKINNIRRNSIKIINLIHSTFKYINQNLTCNNSRDLLYTTVSSIKIMKSYYKYKTILSDYYNLCNIYNSDISKLAKLLYDKKSLTKIKFVINKNIVENTTSENKSTSLTVNDNYLKCSLLESVKYYDIKEDLDICSQYFSVFIKCTLYSIKEYKDNFDFNEDAKEFFDLNNKFKIFNDYSILDKQLYNRFRIVFLNSISIGTFVNEIKDSLLNSIADDIEKFKELNISKKTKLTIDNIYNYPYNLLKNSKDFACYVDFINSLSLIVELITNKKSYFIISDQNNINIVNNLLQSIPFNADCYLYKLQITNKDKIQLFISDKEEIFNTYLYSNLDNINNTLEYYEEINELYFENYEITDDKDLLSSYLENNYNKIYQYNNTCNSTNLLFNYNTIRLMSDDIQNIYYKIFINYLNKGNFAYEALMNVFENSIKRILLFDPYLISFNIENKKLLNKILKKLNIN